MKQCGSGSQIHNQRGGVLLEFTVIIPILLFICFGLVDIGQAFSQKAWLESVAYQSVMMGGELQEERPASMRNISNQLVDILHVKLDKKFVKPNSLTDATEDNTAAHRYQHYSGRDENGLEHD
jgi:Flp pilus assembly protein TadG